MFANNVPSVADIAAVTDGNRNSGGWGDGNGWWVLIILFALFGWGRNGFGGNGDNGSCGTAASCADLQRGFDNQTTQQRFNGIDQGICSLGYDNATLTMGLQNSVNQGFAGLNTAIGNQGYESRLATQQLGAQLASCCCDVRQEIQAGTTQGVMNTNAIQQQIAQCCCDNEKSQMQTRFQMQQDNCATLQAIDKVGDRIIDRMTQQETQRLRDENQALKFQASQVAQNQYLTDTLRPCPTPAYITCNPWGANGYGGYGYGGCCNSGCGCN